MYSKVILTLIGMLLIVQPAALPLSDGVVLAQNDDQIVYAAGQEGAHQLYVMNADGTDAHALTSQAQGDNTEPNWSPDRSMIAYTSDSGGSSEIHVIHADGSGDRQLTSGGGYTANWAPDGQRLAFISDRTGNPQLYVTNADGSSVQQLTNDPNAEATAPAWSPDDQTIAFVNDQNGQSGIWLIAADGTNAPRALTHDPTGEDYGVAWSPDGQHLAYVSTVGGDSDILIVDATGANGTQVASLSSKYADNVTWSPDGKQLAFTAWGQRGPKAIFVVATDGSGDLRQLSQGSDDAGWPSWASLPPSNASVEQPPPINPSTRAVQTIQCPGVLPSRLVPGDTARVTVDGTANWIRNGAGTNHGRIGHIPPGDTFQVLSNPVCDTGYAWYQVNFNGLVGWTAEGDDSSYWIEPYNSSSASSDATHINVSGGGPQVGPSYVPGMTPQDARQNGVPGGVDLITYCYAKGFTKAGNSNGSANGWYCSGPQTWSVNWGQVCYDVYGSNYTAVNNDNSRNGWRCI